MGALVGYLGMGFRNGIGLLFKTWVRGLGEGVSADTHPHKVGNAPPPHTDVRDSQIGVENWRIHFSNISVKLIINECLYKRLRFSEEKKTTEGEKYMNCPHIEERHKKLRK